MERIIVAVKRTEDLRPRDLELPAEMPVADLTRLIADAFQWSKLPAGETYSIKVWPQDIVLTSRQTLLSAQVRAGSMMEFASSAQGGTTHTAHTTNTNQWTSSAATGGVVGGWISLTDNLPTAQPANHSNPPENPNQPAQPGFTWKKIS